MTNKLAWIYVLSSLWGPYPCTNTALVYLLHLLSHPQDRQNGSKPFIPSCADVWGPTHPILPQTHVYAVPAYSLMFIISPGIPNLTSFPALFHLAI